VTYGPVNPQPEVDVRVLGFLGVLCLLVLTILPVAAVAGPTALPASYDETVYGDFEAIGNTVTACPKEPGHHPVKLCHDARGRVGSGPSAQNNGHPMAWADVDSNPGTFNSSSARLDIPSGARIRYAKLTWAGATAAQSVPCGLVKPPGTPSQQAVSLTVNDTTAAVKPGRYTEDTGNTHLDQQFYSAHADVTGHLRGVGGPAAITVGNIWTPQGFDCFGGWSLVAVWAFDKPQAKVAPARKQVTVFDTHTRVFSGKDRADVRLGANRSAGGPGRLSVTGFEGDWALAGDQLRINDFRAGDNVFQSVADGRLNPADPNNMSVDVRTFDVPVENLKTGEVGANLAFTSGTDAYLIGAVAMSSPRPELAIATTMRQSAAHPGDEVTQEVLVTNTGGAPASGVQLSEDLGDGCSHTIGVLKPGQAVKASCTRAAPDTTKQLTAQVTGQSLIGDQLTASDTAPLEIIHPAITAGMTANPDTVLSGQSVEHKITLKNTGDTPLADVSTDGVCGNPRVGDLPPAAEKVVQCSVVAGDEGLTTTVTVAGTDKLGKKVSAQARAGFAVIHPRIDFTVTPSTRAARAGEVVTFTVTIGNPTPIPLTDVRVTGTPESCARDDIGDIAPMRTMTYRCEATMSDRLTVELTVSGTSEFGSRTVHSRLVRTTVSLVPQEVIPVERKAVAVPPVPPVPTAIAIAGLAAISTFVTMGAVSATARAKK
jgi:uncharacterized repeat protein (TIGR01451 family)